MTIHGNDLFGAPVEKRHTSKLGDEFMIPPFSVLSAREGWWQERKRAWLSIGIQSELGRGETAGKSLEMSDTIKRLKPTADPAETSARRRANAAPGGQ